MSDKGTYSHSNRHRMHEENDTPISNTPMSDTPRTDAEIVQFGDGPAKYVYAAFASDLEREIRQLEVAVYDLKTENNLLHEALDQVIEDRDSYHEENAELRRDKDRLDWILSNAGRFWLSTREDIDKEMEESQ